MRGPKKEADEWIRMGIDLWSRLRIEDAEKAFRKAIARKPDYGLAWKYLGDLLLEKQCMEEAESALQKAQSLGFDEDAVVSVKKKSLKRTDIQSERARLVIDLVHSVIELIEKDENPPEEIEKQKSLLSMLVHDEEIAEQVIEGELVTFEEGIDVAIEKFREILSQDPYNMGVLHNLKHALIKQGKATTKVICPHCKSLLVTSIFPSNPMIDLLAKKVFALEFGEIADSVRNSTCEYCNESTVLIFALCQNCFDGWIVRLRAQVETNQGEIKKPYFFNTLISCWKCNYTPKRFESKSPEEKKRFKELLRFRPHLKRFVEDT